MTHIGTPFTSKAVKVMLLGSGELGREVIIALQRFGVETLAVDRYPGAPAMQLAHRAAVIDMLNPTALRELVLEEKPDFIVPEIEAIATEELLRLEEEGFTVIPTARAAQLTMDREGIRRLAAEELKLLTSDYVFASSQEEFQAAINKFGFPVIVKPVMSSSGKGQSVINSQAESASAFTYAVEAGRGTNAKVIIERMVAFDFEITLLTVRHAGGVSFCEPIGHRQEAGDYQESWQPQEMTAVALKESKRVATLVTDALGGVGVFGVELFIKGDQVYFSEVSPRPHDTGMVTLISQNLTEFDLHVRAILGLPIPQIRQHGPAASKVLLARGDSEQVSFSNLDLSLSEPDTDIRLFGKPDVHGERRMGVALALGGTVQKAREKATVAASLVQIRL